MSAATTRGRPIPVRGLISVIRLTARLIIVVVGLPIAFAVAFIERYRRKPEVPRIFWGVEPLINNKYHSRAARLAGYESVTVVDAVYPIHTSEDFDYIAPMLHARRIPPLRLLPTELRLNIDPFLTFCWALRRFDVFVYYATSTILRGTMAKYLELQLLKLARKKLVLLAYGADVQATTRMTNVLYKHALCVDYPDFVRHPERTLRTLHYCSRHADHIMAGVDWVDYMPWWDSLNAGHFAIDVHEWKRSAPSPCRSGDPVVILHAPNHREIKGTRLLMQACEELKSEGVPLELQVVEGLPNTRVRELMRDCDIVADQFIIGWYAMFAIEGMALGKPVICYLRSDLLDLYRLYSFAGECPLVNTPPTAIKETIRKLVDDPAWRAELGNRGRRYVEAHHSLESSASTFDGIFRDLYGDHERQTTAPE